MPKIKELTCIGCPIGCSLTVKLEDGKVESVEGNECKIGLRYAHTECTNPTRMLTSVVKIRNGEFNMMPVKTDKEIPKDLIFEAVNLLYNIVVDAPIEVGDIIVKDILGTGVNFIATRKSDIGV